MYPSKQSKHWKWASCVPIAQLFVWVLFHWICSSNRGCVWPKTGQKMCKLSRKFHASQLTSYTNASTELLLVHNYWFSLLDFNLNSNRIQTWIWGWVMQILPNRLKYLQRLNIKGGVKVAGFKGARINMPQATQWIMERVVINVRLAQIRLRTTPWAVEHLKAPIFAPPHPPPQIIPNHSRIRLTLLFCGCEKNWNWCSISIAAHSALLYQQCNIWTVYNNYLQADVRNWYRCSISAAVQWPWPYKVAQIIRMAAEWWKDCRVCGVWRRGDHISRDRNINLSSSQPRWLLRLQRKMC